MGNTKANQTHDCSLEDEYSILSSPSTGLEMGLTFVTDKKGNPIYEERGDPALANQIYVGLPDYAHLPPEKEIQIGQTDWRMGFGLEYDSGQPDETQRYYQSFGMDLRFRGMAIPGPLPTTATKPSAPTTPTIVNADMELTTNWTNDGADTSERSAAQKHGGTYSWYLQDNDGDCRAYQDLATFQPGATYTLSGWAYDTIAKIGIDDGVTESLSGGGAAGAFGAVSVTKTLSTAATRLRVVLFLDWPGGDVGCYFDDLSITSDDTVGNPKCFAEFNDKLYVSFGQCLAKLNAGGTGFDVVNWLPATITALEYHQYSGTDYLFIGQGSGNKYHYMIANETITLSTVANAEANLLCSLTSSSGSALYLVELPNQLRKSTNPINGGSWGDITYVDAAANNVNALEAGTYGDDGALFMGKEDQPFRLDSDGNIIRLIPSLKSENDTNSGKNTAFWQGSLYIPCGGQALIEYDKSGNVQNLSPAGFTTNDSDFDGATQALAYDGSYLFGLVDNGSKLELVAGRWEIVNGYNDWRWHPLAEITLAEAESAFVSTVYKKRCWIASTSSSDSIYYINLPTGYGNVAADTNLTFKTGGYFYTPWYDANLKGDPKAWRKITLTMAGTDATNYFTVSYQKWGDASWTSIGNFGEAGEDTETIYIPDDASSNKPQGVMIRFKIACTSDGAAPAPQLLSFDCRGIWYPEEKRKLIHMIVKCADNLQIKSKIDDGQSEKDIRDFLNSCYSPDTAWQLAFHPPYWKDSSDTRYVKLVDPFEFRLERIEGGADGTSYIGVFDITMEEVSLS